MSNTYRGKVKILEFLDEDHVKIIFTDDITAGDGAKQDILEGKGALNLKLSHKLMMLLDKAKIPQHTIELVSDNEIIARRLTIFPLEVVVRNYIAGSFARRYGLTEGVQLDNPVVEFFVKDDVLHDPLIDANVAINQKMVTQEQLDLMRARALQVNKLLSDYFIQANMILVDFKLEFGYDKDGMIYVADEISADSMRVWDKETREKLDKDRFRKDLGDVLAGYQAILDRLEKVDSTEPYLVPELKIVASIIIEPKKGVTNPAGEVTKRTLINAGVPEIKKVTMGKIIEVELSNSLGSTWLDTLNQATFEILTNPLIEQYHIRFEFRD